MRTACLSRTTALAGGLALAAVTATGPFAAAEDEPTGPHIEQLALEHETGNQHGNEVLISGTTQVTNYDGSAAVFSTNAALVPWDGNGTYDVYLRTDGYTILVSGTEEAAGNGTSFEPTISNDGRYIAFTTYATDLAEEAGGEKRDVVVRDMLTGVTTLVSRNAAGKPGTRDSFSPTISDNGRYVSFQSFSRLGPKDDDRSEDVYHRDLRRGTTVQASLLPGGKDVRGPVLNGDISDNGRLVTFGNERMLWVRDVVAGTTTRFHREPGTAICNDGHAGSAGRPTLSGDGRYAAFTSCSEELVGKSGIAQAFRVDLQTGETEQLTDGNQHSFHASLSRTGRYVAFGSDATDLVAGDTEGNPDAFRLDTETGEVIRVSETSDGTGGNSYSAINDIAISSDGHAVVFQSYADNLVPGDQYDFEEALLWVDH